jgi:23S rRNA (adenine2503-C2)-methyltransferase
LKVIHKTGNPKLATVYVAQLDDGSCIEFVESLQPPHSINEKWVLIISTLKGCPAECAICDAGGNYKGKLTKEELLWQIEYLVSQKFPDKKVPSKKFKIQFARMGDPAFNTNVISALKELPSIYPNTSIIPSISSIAPEGRDAFFEELIEVKNSFYQDGNFQMQFSIHCSDQRLKQELVPFKTWDFKKISDYGTRFYAKGDRKITLNFATPNTYPLEAATLFEYFDPNIFIIKLTPVNPSQKANKKKLSSLIDTDEQSLINQKIVQGFKDRSYDVILSIGELEENQIGSNCGLYINKTV